MPALDDPAYPCPCCGYLTASDPGHDDICPICGWQDDVSQLRFAGMVGGANSPSLVDAQRNFETFGASDPTGLREGRLRVRPPDAADRRDAGWRSINDDEVEVGEPGVDQGRNYPPSVEQLYYWRPTYWRGRDIAASRRRTVHSFSFPVVEGRLPDDSGIGLNTAFPDDAVIADLDRNMVHVDRMCESALPQLPDIRARLQAVLPQLVFGDPHIWAFREGV